jgi:hypothetical protein
MTRGKGEKEMKIGELYVLAKNPKKAMKNRKK